MMMTDNSDSRPDRERVAELCGHAFADRSRWPESPATSTISDVNQGRGAFSTVLRVELQWSEATHAAAGQAAAESLPTSVVVKLPVDGSNGQAAVNSGAYRREALAYRELLGDADRSQALAWPQIYLVDESGDGTCSLVMEDLSGHRSVDQLQGLAGHEATSVAEGLAGFHRRWQDGAQLDELAVRRNTIAGLAPKALRAGLQALSTIWPDVVSDDQRAAYARLVQAQPRLVDAFEAQPSTLCHGDPRADNLVFARPVGGSGASDGRETIILFDWQQMAVQFGEADLAWLAATSLDVAVRRQVDSDLVTAYGGTLDRYRLGFALPGLTVLLLAQREAATERTRRFIATSLQRIAAAIEDLDVAGIDVAGTA